MATCSFCGGVMAANLEKTSMGLYSKPVCSKNECEAKARAEADEATEALMTPRDRAIAWLARHDFEEQSVKGFWLHKDTVVAVDLNKPSDQFPGLPQIGRIEVNGMISETGHGLSRVDDIRRGLEDVLKTKPQKNGKKISEQKPGQEIALAKIQELELSPETIIKYLCPDATFEEAVLFLQVCKLRNLNPFIPGEVFLVKYDKTQPAATVVGKYAFTKKADEHKDFKGYTAGIIVLNKDGKIEEREGTFYLPRGPNWKDGDVCEILLGGWAKVKRQDREGCVEKVSLQEAIRLNKEGRPVKGWATMPATMVRKVALVRALREAFPAELGGLYDRSEIDGGEN